MKYHNIVKVYPKLSHYYFFVILMVIQCCCNLPHAANEKDLETACNDDTGNALVNTDHETRDQVCYYWSFLLYMTLCIH